MPPPDLAPGRALRGPRRASRAPAWLIAPAMLLASACGLLLIARGPERLFVVALGALLGIAATWILLSIFLPAPVDRTCPACKRATLRRLDPRSARGIACDACGHVDAETSSFCMAEEEGPIESIVLHDRLSERSTR